MAGLSKRAVDAPLSAVQATSRALNSAWTRGLLPRPVITAEALEGAALRGAEPACLGPDTGWRLPFRLLCDSLRDEADLNPLGLAMAHGQIVQLLRARIRATALWRRRPEILAAPLAPPVLILGPMRSGTTRLQRLLACDPRFAHTRLFESIHPVPFGHARGPLDSRPMRARLALLALHRFNPAIGAIHPMRAHDPEEEFGLLSFSFAPPQFEAQWRLPRFVRWWEGADVGFVYAELVALLQTIAWRRRQPAGKPWLLKAPQFLQDLPALLDAFPRARLLCLDRPLDRVVPSAASLVWHQMRIQSDRVDPASVGREWLRKTRLRNARAAWARAAHPRVPQLDVGYEAMTRDWRAEIGRIYAFLGLDLPPAVERRMAAYLAGARRHIGHDYSLEQFGLSRDAVLA